MALLITAEGHQDRQCLEYLSDQCTVITLVMLQAVVFLRVFIF